MSHKKDTDYLSISTRVRAMEGRLLTRDRLERMIDARDDGEALKILTECGYEELSSSGAASLERALSAARTATFRDLAGAVPDRRLVEIYQLKYDYHNAKVLLKAGAMGLEPERLLVRGGRFEPEVLLERWRRDDLRECGDDFRAAAAQAKECLESTGDPQMADVVLDRACYREMGRLAQECGSAFLQGFVRLSVDAANLRSWVRCARLDKGPEFLSQVLLEGGNVSAHTLAMARGQELEACFRSGALAKAAEMGAQLAHPGAGGLTAFERECDNALTAYQESCRRCPFGEQVVAGYLYARESELTAIRTVMAGRLAGLDGDVIRQRLRETYI